VAVAICLRGCDAREMRLLTDPEEVFKGLLRMAESLQAYAMVGRGTQHYRKKGSARCRQTQCAKGRAEASRIMRALFGDCSQAAPSQRSRKRMGEGSRPGSQGPGIHKYRGWVLLYGTALSLSAAGLPSPSPHLNFGPSGSKFFLGAGSRLGCSRARAVSVKSSAGRRI
jgi:hypothetical protein